MKAEISTNCSVEIKIASGAPSSVFQITSKYVNFNRANQSAVLVKPQVHNSAPVSRDRSYDSSCTNVLFRVMNINENNFDELSILIIYECSTVRALNIQFDVRK